MKPIVIIVIAFVLLIPMDILAQEESLSELTARLDAENLEKAKQVGSITTPTSPNSPQEVFDKIDCPSGTYYGLDNQGNPACRDSETNNIVNPQTGFMTDSQTGELILDKDQTIVAWGIIIAVIVVGLAFLKGQSKSKSNKQGSGPRRGWTKDEQAQVRQRQHGMCNHCHNSPPRWEYHHRDGNRSNNSLSNCEGLCPNCHSEETYG